MAGGWQEAAGGGAARGAGRDGAREGRRLEGVSLSRGKDNDELDEQDERERGRTGPGNDHGPQAGFGPRRGRA